MTSVSLFQLGPVHEEVALGFCEALGKLGFKIKVWLHKQSLNKKGDVFASFPIQKNLTIKYHKIPLRGPIETEQLNEVIEDQPDLIIMLTLQNSRTEFIADYFSDSGIKIAGVVHNNTLIEKKISLARSFNIKKFFPIFLSYHVLKKSYNWNTNEKSFVFYNIFSPTLNIQKNSSQHIFSILGGVSLKRLAYSELMNTITENQLQWKGKLKIQIVGGGKDRELLLKIAKENEIEDFLIFSELDEKSNMTNYESYYKYISKSDAILCLARKGIFASLAEYKITSSVPSAISFCKPLICSSQLAQRHNVCSISITGATLSEQINNMIFEYNSYGSFDHLKDASERIRGIMQELNISTLLKILD